MKEIKRKIHIPIYGGWLIVVITDSTDLTGAGKKYLGCKDDLSKYAACVLRRDNDLPRYYPVMFSTNNHKGMTPATVAHEAYHLLNHLYKDLGICHEWNNDESAAYLLEWIVRVIWEVKEAFDKLK